MLMPHINVNGGANDRGRKYTTIKNRYQKYVTSYTESSYTRSTIDTANVPLYIGKIPRHSDKIPRGSSLTTTDLTRSLYYEHIYPFYEF